MNGNGASNEAFKNKGVGILSQVVCLFSDGISASEANLYETVHVGL